MLCYIAAASFARFRSMASVFFFSFLLTDEKFSNSLDSVYIVEAGRLLRASGHLFFCFFLFIFPFLLFQSVTFVRSPRRLRLSRDVALVFCRSQSWCNFRSAFCFCAVFFFLFIPPSLSLSLLSLFPHYCYYPVSFSFFFFSTRISFEPFDIFFFSFVPTAMLRFSPGSARPSTTIGGHPESPKPHIRTKWGRNKIIFFFLKCHMYLYSVLPAVQHLQVHKKKKVTFPRAARLALETARHFGRKKKKKKNCGENFGRIYFECYRGHETQITTA